MIESEADRLAYLQALGEEWSTPAGKLWAIFDNEYAEASGEVDVETRTPVLLCRESDAKAQSIGKGTAVTRAGRQYVVRRLEPDGVGMMRLILEG